MKLTCSKANLLKGVNIVSKAVPSKTTMSILECILIDASTNEIKFTANDMELGIETKVEGTIAEKGIVAIDAKVFSEIVNYVTMMLQSIAIRTSRFLLIVRKQIFIFLENQERTFPICLTLRKQII